jgi:hypothetical protein
MTQMTPPKRGRDFLRVIIRVVFIFSSFMTHLVGLVCVITILPKWAGLSAGLPLNWIFPCHYDV